ncbi:hypothetical protein ScPMuIL_015208 [Solemya velum]
MDVPGPKPTSEKDGNIPDFAAAGSLHEYLVKLHKEYGPITSFWMGGSHVVSIASPELFKQHQHLFDRPPELHKLFEAFVGPKAIVYANGADGKNRRSNYDKALSKERVKEYYATLQEIANEVIDKYTKVPTGEKIALNTSMSVYALKVNLVLLFGDHFHKEEEMLAFHEEYDTCWSELERRRLDPSPPSSERQERFDKAKSQLKELINAAIEHRRNEAHHEKKNLLIDLIEECSSSEEQIVSDSTNYAIGIYASWTLMTWGLYYLAQNQEVQQKVYEEIKSALRDDEGVQASNMGALPYMMQVIDETIRCSVITPYAGRFEQEDAVLDGYHIPKNTTVIHALGVVLQDEKYWPDPDKFDPDRFSPANVKERSSMAYVPFGFAGKRTCPATDFAYAETCVLFAALLRKFEIKLAGPQSIKRIHGLITHPSEEIWITLNRR